MTNYEIKDQLNLFEMLEPKEDNTLKVIAEWFCDEFNLLNTVWKNTFRVDSVKLEKWEHVQQKKATLEIYLKTYHDVTEKDGWKWALTQFGDQEKAIQLLKEIRGSMLLSQCNEDEDFSISVTPWFIAIYWKNFEDKEFKMDKNLQALQHLCQQCKNHEICQGTGCEPRNKLQKLIEKEQNNETK